MNFLSSSRFWLLLSLAVLPLAISNDSLWLDEGDTAMYALEPTFHSWWQRLLHDGQADCQMPLSMLCAWVGGKILGTQEWQLRAVNLLWGALALVAMHRVGRRLQMPWLPGLLVLQPYFWFYLNEARPYASQLGCGAWLLVALVEFYQARGQGTAWAWLLAAAGFAVYCTTLLGPLPVAATVTAMGFIAWREGWRPSRRAVCVLLGGLVACVPLAIYYLGTLLRGAKGMQIWPVDVKFFAYVLYELAGLGGVGLSGAEIRVIARSPQVGQALAAHWPQLVLPLVAGTLLAGAVFIGLRRRWREGQFTRAQLDNALAPSPRPSGERVGVRGFETMKPVASSPRPSPPSGEEREKTRTVSSCTQSALLPGMLLVPVLTASVFVTISLGLQKAFWARHYAPVFPFYVALLGLALAGIFSSRNRWLRLLPLLICVMLAAGSLRFRFAESLRKEDYRAAAAYVRPLVAQGRDVWWLAGEYSANYYGLKTTLTRPESGRVYVPFHRPGNVGALPLPDVIVLAKPDVHDPAGTAQKIMAENPFSLTMRCQGFTVWTNMLVR